MGEDERSHRDPEHGMDDDGRPHRAAIYTHPDGTNEVVFHVEAEDDPRILTVREYETAADFREAIREATYVGTHPGVEDLPDVEQFRRESAVDDER